MANVNLTVNEIFNILADINDKFYFDRPPSGATLQGAKKLWDSLSPADQAKFDKSFPKQFKGFKEGLGK
ncbi:hypothetical protein [Neobacillus sp. Marseille-QA0830]